MDARLRHSALSLTGETDMEYNEKSAGNSFEKLLAEFVEKTGVKTDGAGPNSIDVIADDVMVSAQYGERAVPP